MKGKERKKAMPFLLEELRFIEAKVYEQCIALKRYDQEFINKSVDEWINIMGFTLIMEWEKILIPQTKKHIFRTLNEGKYYYGTLQNHLFESVN